MLYLVALLERNTANYPTQRHLIVNSNYGRPFVTEDRLTADNFCNYMQRTYPEEQYAVLPTELTPTKRLTGAAAG